jgi:branched-chain amino acid transport system ATP-binding protein
MLEVNNIDVFHGGLQALWKVSLDVDEGEIVSLIGANGAGKSTIVETIASLLTPASGDIRFQGIRLDKEAAHRVVTLGVCLIPEERGRAGK